VTEVPDLCAQHPASDGGTLRALESLVYLLHPTSWMLNARVTTEKWLPCPMRGALERPAPSLTALVQLYRETGGSVEGQHWPGLAQGTTGLCRKAPSLEGTEGTGLCPLPGCPAFWITLHFNPGGTTPLLLQPWRMAPLCLHLPQGQSLPAGTWLLWCTLRKSLLPEHKHQPHEAMCSFSQLPY
jgi:hypothetical protein